MFPNYYGGGHFRQGIPYFACTVAKLAAGGLALSCATSGVLHAQLLAGGGRQPGSYYYLEVIEAPGESSVARAVEATDAHHTKTLGNLEYAEIKGVREAAGVAGIVGFPRRFGTVTELAQLESPAPGRSWTFTVASGETGVLAIESTEDRIGSGVLAFIVKTVDGRRSGWIAEIPRESAKLVTIALLTDKRRAVAEVAFDRGSHKVVALYELDLAGGLARLLDEEGIAWMAEKHYAEARDRLERALTLAPDDATTRYNFACLLTKLGRHDEAIRELSEAVRSDPHYLASTARHDPDLIPLRSRPDFKALVGPKGDAAEP